MKRIKIEYINVLFLLSLMVICYSCRKNDAITQEDLIKEYIDEKLSESRVKFIKECYSNTILEAEAYVDSIIAQQINFMINDTIRTPGKPAKPNRPYDTLKLENTIIAPILNDTIIKNQRE